MRPTGVQKIAIIQKVKEYLYELTDSTFILNKYLHIWCEICVVFKQRKVERSQFRSYHESILNIYK